MMTVKMNMITAGKYGMVPNGKAPGGYRFRAVRNGTQWDVFEGDVELSAGRYVATRDDVAAFIDAVLACEAEEREARRPQETRDWCARRIVSQRDADMAEMKKFSAEVLKNPYYAMRWADRAFVAAARHQTMIVVIDLMTRTDGAKLEWSQTHKWLMDGALTDSRSLGAHASTSASSNVSERCYISERIRIAEMIENIEDGPTNWPEGTIIAQ